MRHEIRVPKLGLTMTEGTLVEWCVEPGAAFTKGQTLFVIESEKAASEIPADADGVLVETLADAGVTLPCGALIGHWEGEQGAGRADEPVQGGAGASAREPVKESARTSPASLAAVTTHNDPAKRVVATPLAKRMARNHTLDLHGIHGSGPGGRIRATDVQGLLDALSATDNAQADRADAAGDASSDVQKAQKLRPATALERTRADRLTAAKQQVPHFYMSLEANVTALIQLRKELNAAQETRRFTLNHFILAAVGAALSRMPEANVVWTDKGILELGSTDVGMAVNTDKGLYVPMLRDVGALSLSSIAKTARGLIDRAQAGRLSAHEMSGGAISVSNAGMYDVTYMTSIINPGQSMILGVGSLRDVFRPDENGQPSLRREMGLVLSADHRVLDGVMALRFLKLVVDALEQPLSLMVQA